MITDNVEWFKEKIERDELVDKILISPFGPEQRECLEAASFDLRVGEKFESVTHDRSGEISEKKSLLIKPSETVKILSYEYIGLPQSIAASVTSKLSLSMLGLSQLSTRIDPGFYGKITEVVTNLSNREIELKYKQPFCTLLFLELDHPSPDQRYRGDYLGKTEIRTLKKFGPLSADRPASHRELEELKNKLTLGMRAPSVLYHGFTAISALFSALCASLTAVGFFPLLPGLVLTVGCVLTLAFFIIAR